MQIFKKIKMATISDLRDINRILKKVRERDSRLKYERLGDRGDLIVVGIGGASFKTQDKAIGVLLFLANSEMARVAPIYSKAKQIDRVSHS